MVQPDLIPISNDADNLPVFGQAFTIDQWLELFNAWGEIRARLDALEGMATAYTLVATTSVLPTAPDGDRITGFTWQIEDGITGVREDNLDGDRRTPNDRLTFTQRPADVFGFLVRATVNGVMAAGYEDQAEATMNWNDVTADRGRVAFGNQITVVAGLQGTAEGIPAMRLQVEGTSDTLPANSRVELYYARVGGIRGRDGSSGAPGASHAAAVTLDTASFGNHLPTTIDNVQEFAQFYNDTSIAQSVIDARIAALSGYLNALTAVPDPDDRPDNEIYNFAGVLYRIVDALTNRHEFDFRAETIGGGLIGYTKSAKFGSTGATGSTTQGDGLEWIAWRPDTDSDTPPIMAVGIPRTAVNPAPSQIFCEFHGLMPHGEYVEVELDRAPADDDTEAYGYRVTEGSRPGSSMAGDYALGVYSDEAKTQAINFRSTSKAARIPDGMKPPTDSDTIAFEQRAANYTAEVKDGSLAAGKMQAGALDTLIDERIQNYTPDSGSTLPDDPSDGDEFNLLTRQTERQGTDAVLAVTSNGRSTGSWYTASDPAASWAFTLITSGSSTLIGNVYMVSGGTPRPPVAAWISADAGANWTRYPLDEVGAPFQHYWELRDEAVTDWPAGNYVLNLEYADGSLLVPSKVYNPGHWSYSTALGDWTPTPGLAESWAQHGNTEPITPPTKYPLRLIIDGPGVGWNTQSTGTVNFGTQSLLGEDGRTIDVSQDRAIWIDAEATIVASGDPAVGFNQGSTASNKVTVERDDAMVASRRIRATAVNTNTSPDEDNGVRVIRFFLWSGATLVGIANVLVGRNRQNRAIYRGHWENRAGTQSLEIGIDLFVVTSAVSSTVA